MRQFEDQARAHSLVQLEIPLEIRERNDDIYNLLAMPTVFEIIRTREWKELHCKRIFLSTNIKRRFK